MASNEIDDNGLGGEGRKDDRTSLWLWLFLLALLIGLLSTIQTWMDDHLSEAHAATSFYHVTNRDFSLFLWENPQFMRINVSSKQAYLPGYQYLDTVAPYPEKADELVQAPPEVLFNYHTWHHLIGDDTSDRPITVNEFQQFLASFQEWLPKWWPEAPSDYVKLIDKLPVMLGNQEVKGLPIKVRLAVLGWKNYYIEGDAINKMEANFGQLKAFLAENPHFARNYWRNLTLESAPNYLKTITFGNPKDKDIVPNDEYAPFLRVSLFNFIKAPPVEPKKT
jgi:hypothetical protein